MRGHGLNAQRQVTSAPDAVPGMARQVKATESISSSGTATAQTIVLDITGAVDSTVYTVTVNGISINASYVATNGFAFGAIAAGTAITDTIMRNVLLYELQIAAVSVPFNAVATGTNQITLTNGSLGDNAAFSVSGGAQLTINSNVAATSGVYIPVGSFLVQGSLDPNDYNTRIALPSITGQSVFGILMRSSGNYARLTAYEASRSGVPEDSLPPGEQGTAIKEARYVYVIAEAEFTAAGADVYFRHTADGTLTQLGVAAPAAGTGLDLIPNTSAKTAGPSIAVGDGTLAVPLNVDFL